MTRHNELSGVRTGLADRLRPATDSIARRMVAAFIEDVPVYAALPQEQLDGEILDICRTNLLLFLDCLAEDRRLLGPELADLRASAARRAEERVPLDDVLTAYHVGGRIGWEALKDAATVEETDELLAAATTLMTYLQDVTGAVAAAYLEERQSIHSEERDARRAVADALLSGTSPEAAASRAEVALADDYLVLALSVGPSPDEKADAGVTSVVAARRKTRRIEASLSAWAGAGLLTLLDSTGGIALAPLPERDIVALAADLSARAGADVWIGASSHSGVTGVPTAAAEAREVLRLAVDLGEAPGAYRIDDVLLEFVVSRPAVASSRLTDLLAPLERKPDLLATLDAWFEHDFDRRRAATALHVHPNTLDYRLGRAAVLLGVDLSTAKGLQLVGAALLNRRVAR